jgi:hypothetical protein
MIKELVKMAGELDRLGLKREADAVDGMIRKIAASEKSYHKEFGTGDYGIYHIMPNGVNAITWFDTLEEAQRELATGWYYLDFGPPYIVERDKEESNKEESNEKPKPTFLPPDEDGDTILSDEDIAKLPDDILSFMVEAEGLDKETRTDLEMTIWECLRAGRPITVDRLKSVIGMREDYTWKYLGRRFDEGYLFDDEQGEGS